MDRSPASVVLAGTDRPVVALDMRVGERLFEKELLTLLGNLASKAVKQDVALTLSEGLQSCRKSLCRVGAVL